LVLKAVSRELFVAIPGADRGHVKKMETGELKKTDL
jgi:hypothetical protein